MKKRTKLIILIAVIVIIGIGITYTSIMIQKEYDHKKDEPLLERINLGQFNAIIGGIMVACFLYFLYLNKPEKLQNQTKGEEWSYSVLLTRLLVIVPFVGIIVYYYFR